MLNRTQVQQALDAGGGLLRLEPCWVPRSFMIPGRRLKLHPDDLYALGAHRGGINERWFSSTTNADNGPGTPDDEGLSYVRLANGGALPVQGRRRRRPAICCSARTSWQREGGWNLLCKFFDNMGADPASHAPERRAGEAASAARASPRPTTSRRSTTRPTTTFRYTFMGLEPGTTKEDVRRCLENWNKGDNGITLPVARLPAAARHRLADRSRHPARARLARHLRAAGEQRRVRDVPVRGRRPHRRLGAC